MSKTVDVGSIKGVIDFALITIREDEFRAALKYFPTTASTHGGRRTYEISCFTTRSGRQYCAALLRTFEQGHASAQAAASDVLVDLDPQWLVLVGIAGAVPEFEFTLGDVVVATRISDFSISAALANGLSQVDARGGPLHFSIQDLAARLPTFEAELQGWNDPIHLAFERPTIVAKDDSFGGDDGWKEKICTSLQHHFGPAAAREPRPRVVAGSIASANMLVKDPAVVQRWLDHARSIKAIEMEIPGVYEASRSRHGDRPVLAVRGISDVVGFTRDPKWTEYACRTAAAFTRALLETAEPIEPASAKDESRLEGLLGAAMDGIGNVLAARVFPGMPTDGQTPKSERIATGLKDHFIKLTNWSAHIQFSLLPSPKSVDEDTVALKFSTIPRRYKSTGSITQSVSEADLLKLGRHLVIVGGPGAGKTTTLKRIARRLLLGAFGAAGDVAQMPLLIRLRTLNEAEDTDSPLLIAIARELGMVVSIPESRDLQEERLPTGEIRIRERVLRGAPQCEGGPIAGVVSRTLAELGPVLMLDGLDEVNSGMRAKVEADIEKLLESASGFIVLLTCRSGEYRRLGYLSELEVCGLEAEEIHVIASKWLGENCGDFLLKVSQPALSDLSRKPLFLAQMLAVYSGAGYLPSQPCDLYESLTLLLIRDWDRENRTLRRSRYADFGAERKLKFLACLSFQLTYIQRIKEFSSADLAAIYAKIRRHFGLPQEESSLVVSEVESHTGIVAEIGMRRYEFSHLTIQEYLCAEYLVRMPISDSKIAGLLNAYPPPLAIATALSTDPAAWLARILQNYEVIKSNSTNSVAVFLQRLDLENPAFTGGTELGTCAIALFNRATREADRLTREKIINFASKILENKPALSSLINLLIDRYLIEISTEHPATYRLTTEKLKGELDDELESFTELEDALMPKDWFDANVLTQGVFYNGRRITRRA